MKKLEHTIQKSKSLRYQTLRIKKIDKHGRPLSEKVQKRTFHFRYLNAYKKVIYKDRPDSLLRRAAIDNVQDFIYDNMCRFVNYHKEMNFKACT